MKPEALSKRGDSLYESCIFSSVSAADRKFRVIRLHCVVSFTISTTQAKLTPFHHDDGVIPNSLGDQLASDAFGQFSG